MKLINFRRSVFAGIFLIVSILFVAIFFRSASYQAKIREMQYDHWIYPEASLNGVDPLLVRALIWRESRFNPNARGDDGERGLMQIMESVAADWARVNRKPDFDVEQLFDPQTNIRMGTWHLGRSVKRWREHSDPYPFALAEYNAGRATVLRWLKGRENMSAEEFMAVIEYPSTRRYIQIVLSKHEEYRSRIFIPSWADPFFRRLPDLFKIAAKQ